MRTRITAPLVIAALCLSVAAVVMGLAAPSKRLIVAIVVVLPFVFAAFVALRKHGEHVRFLDLHATAPGQSQPLSTAIPDPATFIANAAGLANDFRTWAATLDPTPVNSLSELEDFAARHANAVAGESSLFLNWVAAYGEAVRSSTNGRWAIGRLAAHGEPIIVSGRFPFLRHRVLLAAIQVLDAAEDLKWQRCDGT